MKKKALMLLVACTLTCFTIAGCGLTETSSESEEEREENEEEEATEEPEEASSENVSNASQTFSCLNLHGVDEGQLSDVTELALLNDTDCMITNTITYQDNSEVTNVRYGTYTLEDNVYRVEFENYGEMYIGEYTVEGDKIEDYSEIYAADDCSEIVGTYTCESDLGSMVMIIDRDGIVTLTIDNKEYTGTVFIFEGEWDVMVEDANYEESYDLMCTFNDDGTFTYYEYGENAYAPFEGSYTATGDLGTVTYDVSADGTVSAVVPIDGQNMQLTGNIYADNTVLDRMNITVYDADQTICVDLYLRKDGDTWTYTGAVTTYNYLPGYEDLEYFYY